MQVALWAHDTPGLFNDCTTAKSSACGRRRNTNFTLGTLGGLVLSQTRSNIVPVASCLKTILISGVTSSPYLSDNVHPYIP